MGFSGDLTTLSLADVFQNLSQSQQTGILKVFDKNTEKHIFFSKGRIRTISIGRERSAPIGQILLSRGSIDKDSLKRALDKQKSSDLLIGEILIQENGCSQEALDSALKFQMEEEIYDLFSWENARFSFEENQTATAIFGRQSRTSQISMNTTILIMEALRRIDEWSNIKEIIKSTSSVPVALGKKVEDLSPKAEKVLEFCDGTATIHSISLLSCLGLFETGNGMVELIKNDLVRFAEKEELAKNADLLIIKGKPVRAADICDSAIEQFGPDEKMALCLANSLEACGQSEKASLRLCKISKSFIKSGNLSAAMECLKRADSLGEIDVESQETLAELYLANKHEDEALKLCRKILKNTSAKEEAEEALKIAEKIIDNFPKDEIILSNFARLQLESGKSHDACNTYVRLAFIQKKADKTHEALSSFRNAAALNSSRSDIRDNIKEIENKTREGKKKFWIKVVPVSIFAFLIILSGIIVKDQLKAKKEFDELSDQVEVFLSAKDNAWDSEKMKSAQNLIEKIKKFSGGMSFTDFPNLTSELEEVMKDKIKSVKTQMKLSEESISIEHQKLYELASLSLSSDSSEERTKGIKAMEKLSKMPDNTEWKEKAIKQLEIFSNKNKRASAIYRLYKSATGKEKFTHAKSLLEKFPAWSAQMGVKVPVQINLDHYYHAEVMIDGKVAGKINPKDNGDYINLKVSGQTLVIKCKGFGENGYTTHHITREELAELSKPLLKIKLKRSARWVKTCEEPLISAVLPTTDFVVANTTRGSVFAFNKNDGLQVWNKQISNRAEFRSPPAFINEKIWVFDYGSGKIYSLTSQNGNIATSNSARQIQNEGGMRSKIIFFKSILDRDAVLFAGGVADGKIICVNAVTGITNGVVYKSDSNLPVKTKPMFLNNIIIFIDPQGKVNGILPNGSKVFVIKNNRQSSVAAIAKMKNTLFTISEDGYAKRWNNINNGNQPEQQWRTRYSLGSNPTFLEADDNYLITIVEGNRVIGINQKNGKVIWEAPYLTSKPFINIKLNGRILLLWSPDTLYAIDTHKRGTLIWKYRCNAKSSIGGITADKESIILSFEDGTIHYLDRTDYK